MDPVSGIVVFGVMLFVVHSLVIANAAYWRGRKHGYEDGYDACKLADRVYIRHMEDELTDLELQLENHALTGEPK